MRREMVSYGEENIIICVCVVCVLIFGMASPHVFYVVVRDEIKDGHLSRCKMALCLRKMWQ